MSSLLDRAAPGAGAENQTVAQAWLAYNLDDRRGRIARLA